MKKNLLKRWEFWTFLVIAIFLLFVIIGSGGNDSDIGDVALLTSQLQIEKNESTIEPKTERITSKTNTSSTTSTITSTTTTTTSKPPTTTTTTKAQTKSRTIYVTPTGKRYHYDNSCGRGSYSASTLADAQRMGLTACKKCAGG